MLYLIATTSILLYGMLLFATDRLPLLQRVVFPVRQSLLPKRLFNVMRVVITLWGALFTVDAIISLRNGSPDTSALFVFGLLYLLGVVVIHIARRMPRSAVATREHPRVSVS